MTTTPPDGLGTVLGRAAAAHAADRTDRFLDLARQAARLADGGGVPHAGVPPLLQVAVDALYEGETDVPEALFLAALPALEQPEDAATRASVLHNLALLALTREDFARAHRLDSEGRDLAAAAGEPLVEAECLHGIGAALVAQRDYPPACAPLERCLALFEELGDEDAVAAAAHSLAMARQELGDLERARELFGRCVAIWRASGYGHGLTEALQGIGEIAQSRGEYREAVARHADALPVLLEMDELPGVSESLEGVALALAGAGRTEDAVRLFAAATGIRDRLGAEVPPAVRERVAGDIARARTALGAGPFRTHWAWGHALATEEAVAYALGRDGDLLSRSGPE
ncbi:tetratricopeptide repeat protein [Streptomyces physcomitrii]|uniref:Tetratricopeptide repeat protein n=1 Tax=Streptomyces physcomitrii TaxID=2724184 RepID=A0ABX1H7W5_9ACTN|nr:tetratricopeptide repeat protein [Streptomyces physcomitrii]NKI44153.1 tetratricopeptide repeat protein [Streptomyces physcomitrii]